jgi:hypothetical protein
VAAAATAAAATTARHMLQLATALQASEVVLEYVYSTRYYYHVVQHVVL